MTVDGDPVVDLVGFAGRLRIDGLRVEVARLSTALRALGAYEPLDRDGIYWAMRLTLCSRREDLPVFDAAFAAWFGPVRSASPVVPAPRAPERHGEAAGEEPTEDGDAPRTDRTRAGSAERLAPPPPWPLTPADHAELESFIQAFTSAVPLRRTMRRAAGGRRYIDVSRTARTMMRSAGEPTQVWHHRRLHARRRLVLLLDLSHSMRKHRGLLLRFGYAAVAAAPLSTEVFTIGTRLDRITCELRSRDPQSAMSALAARRMDWDAGTRLGSAVTAFGRLWGGHRVVRSANLVIVSDGWEYADPAPLVAQVSRLSRLAHRVIWGHPRAGEPGFVPYAPALKDSLPYVQLVPTPDATALRSLADLLACPTCRPHCPRHREFRKWSVPT
ncbi:VWA domain-containing protein [Micromonospora sp. NPDC047527]|uniref:VWA domain-containing protein n=1 Tax=Micromonospora sp. NPDC047527 TaxID=3155144 RepID=UPI0033C729BF